MTAPLSPTPPLTPREIEVMRLVARGHPNREIAELLGTAVGTIDTQVVTALQRLRARNRAHACSILDDMHPGWRPPLGDPRPAQSIVERLRVIVDELAMGHIR